MAEVTTADLLQACRVAFRKMLAPAVFVRPVAFLTESALLATYNFQWEVNDTQTHNQLREMVHAAWQEYRQHVTISIEIGLELAVRLATDTGVCFYFSLSHESIPEPYKFWVAVDSYVSRLLIPTLEAVVQDTAPEEEETDD